MTYIPSIGTARLQNDAVTSAKVLNGELVAADLAAAAGILFTQLEAVPWHSGNDGAGSGLDADLLDAQSGAFYLARANHTGTQTASTISDFDTQVRTNRLDQMAAPTASVSFNNQKITSLADPTAAQEAATKAYVDGVASGLDLKASVRLATAAALPSNTRTGNVLTATANGALSVDGVAVAVGNRILVKDEATGANNGIYDVTAAGDGSNPFVLTRSSDADASAEVTAGMFTFAAEGTTNADTGWVLTTNDAITLNTTALAFTQFSGAGQITAGAGLTKTGNTLDVGAGTGISVAADSVGIDTAVVPQKSASNTWSGTNTFNAKTTFGGGINRSTDVKSANYTAVVDLDDILLVDSSGGAITITLPASHSAGDTLTIKRNGANNVVLDPADADTVDGASTFTLDVDDMAVQVVSDGTNWHVI